MSEKTLERQPSIDEILVNEQSALREIQLIREQREMEGLNERVLHFEESGGIRIVSYNDFKKETVFRDADGKEQVELQEVTLDEKEKLDNMFDIVQEYEKEEMNIDDVEIPDIHFDEDRFMDDDFVRDDIDDFDRDDDMEYDG